MGNLADHLDVQKLYPLRQAPLDQRLRGDLYRLCYRLSGVIHLV